MNNPESKNRASILLIKNYLLSVLSENISADACKWLEDKIKEIEATSDDLIIYQAFGRIPSITGKAKLNLSNTHLHQAGGIKAGWCPARLHADQAARIVLLLSIAAVNENEFEKKVRTFFDVAEVGEAATLYLGFPVFPQPEKFIDLAVNGVRSNMKILFEAIALQNPYPAAHFDINAWNQMILKAFFIGSPVCKIYGLDKRSNLKLAYMLSDYAHERWAAGRKVNPELWRLVGPFIDEKIIRDIELLFSRGDDLEKEAAALACAMSSYPDTRKILQENKGLYSKTLTQEITWDTVAQKLYSEKQTA
ncbi:MAG: EboA domain-containing protein [Cytophagaceae bacterium]|nr:EboA domain-containing protein [Cytophagaceae bacterium]